MRSVVDRNVVMRRVTVFHKPLCGWCEDSKKLLFTGLGIEASESPVYERSEALCPSPKVTVY